MDERRNAAELVRRRWASVLDEVGADAEARYRDGETMPRRFLELAGQVGISGLSFAKKLGGGGADLRTWGRVVEETAFRCAEPAFPIVMSMGTGVASVLAESERADLVEQYVQPIIRGERTATLAFSEDADQFSMRTALRRSGDAYTLSGTKDYITGALTADVFLTYARDDAGGLVGCLVHRDDDGVTVAPAAGIGFRTCGMGRLELRDVRLPAERIVAQDGFSHAQFYLNYRRLILTCLVTGLMRALFARCLDRLRTAVRHEAAVIELPNVQAAVGRMHISVEATRAMLHSTLGKVSDGVADPLFDAGISSAKHFATEQAMFLVGQALRVLGGHGYYGDHFYGMYLRDCVGLLCAAGTQDLIEINIGALVAKNLAPHLDDGEVPA